MFIDYLPLMLINMVAGYFLLAFFVYRGLVEEAKQKWAPPFFMVGLVAFLTGLHMVFTWPLPGSYNIAFGENSVLFGAVFLATGWALSKNWELLPVALYGLVAGIMAIVTGTRIINQGMTQAPLLSGLGFILSGLAGIMAPAVLYTYTRGAVHRVGMGVLVIAGLIWAVVGYMAIWGHLERMAGWVPLP